MKKYAVTLLLIVFMSCGSIAFAQEIECVDCDCEKGGLGLKLGNFVAGFGVRTFNSIVGCNNNIGIGIGIGSETNGSQIGFGYNDGVIGLGIAFKGPETTTSIGFGIGYDYGDCRLVWPYDE
jgi:hypothetical protein